MKKFVFVVSLLLVSSVSPLVFGYDVEPVDTELDKMLDDLRFVCTTPNGFSEEKYEYYKDQLLEQYSSESLNGDIIIEPELTMTIRVESPAPVFTGGPMDSAWPMQSHDNHHTGQSPYSTADTTNTEKWQFVEDRGIETCPVIDSDGVIYIGHAWGDLIAVYPDGSEKWRYTLDGQILGSSPAIAEDGTIYIGSWDDCLYAIYPDGARKWKFNANSANIASSPAIAEDGTIYFGTLWSLGDGGKIFAVNPNGTEKWSYQTGYAITSDPAIGDDGTIYIGSGDSYLYAMNPDGTEKWKFNTGDEIHGHPAIGNDGTIYIGSYDDYFYAVNPDGTEKWKFHSAWGTGNSAAIANDGTIYVGTDVLYARNPDGSHKWAFNLGNHWVGTSSPAVSADGTIYVGATEGNFESGSIFAINSDGTEKWRKQISDEWVSSSPSIAEDGTVYICTTEDVGDGYLHAFDQIEYNEPPTAPTITGPNSGNAGESYTYTFVSNDPEGYPLKYYIEWGDDTSTGWTGEYESGEEVEISHTWTEQGTYEIRAKAKDVCGEDSSWGTLDVTMPKNKPFFFDFGLLEWLLERLPSLKLLISYIFN